MIFKFPTPVFNAEGTGGGGAAPPPADGGAAPAAPATWYGGYDAETQGWVQNRGYHEKDLAAAMPEVIKGYRNAEKMLGVPENRIIKLPEQIDDAAFLDIANRLGRPADPKEYVIQNPQGQEGDAEFADWARSTFHKLGLTKSQGEKLVQAWNENVTGVIAKAGETQQQQAQAQEASLKKEWGQAYDQNVEIGKRAARAAAQEVGLTEDNIDQLEAAIGLGGVLKLFHFFGSKMMDDTFTTGQVTPPGGRMLTPEQAQARITDLNNDAAWRKAFLAGDAEKRAEWDRLHQMAYGA